MPPLPALQIRVPNPANALLQAEQILGARAQRNALAQQTQRQGQIAKAFALNDPFTPAGQQAIVQRVGAIDPQQALQFQQSFNALGAQDRARVQQEGQQVSRALFGVTNQAQYDQARSTLPPAIANGLPAEFQPQVVRSLVQASRSIDSMFAGQAQQGFTLSPGQTRFGPAGQPIAGVAPTPKETFRTLTDAERGLFGIPADQPAQISETTGKVSTIGAGGVEVNVDLSTKTQGAIEGSILGAQDALGRLTAIENSFDPTFQQIFTRAGIKFDQLRARFGELSPEDQARLQRAAVFQQNAIENVNSTIRELTGAQMSEFEANRITAQLPNPGTGIFDGDDPVSFEAKMRNATRRIRVILARKVWADVNGKDALTTGFDMDGSVREIVNQRGQEIEDAFKTQGMTGEELDSAVNARLRIEFGGLLGG